MEEPEEQEARRMFDARFFLSCILIGLLTEKGAAQVRPSFTDRPVPGMRQMDRHNPFSPGYVDMTPGGSARRQLYGPGYGYSFWPTYSSTFYFGGPIDYGYFEPAPYFGYDYFGPPLSFDYGAFDAYPIIPWAPPALLPPEQGAAVPSKPLIKTRPLNAEALARAGRYLSAGDEHFAAQRYRDANARYRSATEAADLVEAFFRQGQALVATGTYELAGKAFKRGMKLSDKWPQANFSLTELYGANQVAKGAHMEALAAAAGDAPHDGTLLLLVGLELYFDGQQERSLPFFRKAEALLAGEGLNLNAVLKP